MRVIYFYPLTLPAIRGSIRGDTRARQDCGRLRRMRWSRFAIPTSGQGSTHVAVGASPVRYERISAPDEKEPSVDKARLVQP